MSELQMYLAYNNLLWEFVTGTWTETLVLFTVQNSITFLSLYFVAMEATWRYLKYLKATNRHQEGSSNPFTGAKGTYNQMNNLKYST